MTLIEAINKLDSIKPNGYMQTEKVAWLSELDGMIKELVIDTHELNDGEEVTFEGYTDETPLDTKLLVHAPYEDLYVLWLESKVDYTNGEYVKYNNSITRYNDIFKEFNNHYNRTHMPIGKKIKYF